VGSHLPLLIAGTDHYFSIPIVIDSFVKLRRKLDMKLPASQTPQLLICGHGAIDDPDATIIYSEVLALLETEQYAPYAAECVLAPSPKTVSKGFAALSSCAFLRVTKVSIFNPTKRGENLLTTYE